MPRENRKRGKKHKKQPEQEELEAPAYHEPAPQEKPSWIVPRSEQNQEDNIEAPFGYVDADVKAYFRTVDDQIRDWQQNGHVEEQGEGDLDPNEARKLFFVAALTELSGKEKQLATDPDCSNVMERMTFSMDDFAKRVLLDSLTGSYEALFKHRFASHVCQTLFTVAGDTVSRETRGILPSVPSTPGSGELRTMTKLVLDTCNEILPFLSSLLLDPFGSHVVRALVVLLAPSLDSNSNDGSHSSSALRSKRSAAWKARQGPMTSVFNKDGVEGTPGKQRAVPNEFTEMLRTMVENIKRELGENEVRAMAASKVGSPVLKVLLEAEASLQMHNIPGSLMDHVSVGLISTCQTESSEGKPEASDYLLTLLRDPTSSHLFETLLTLAPPAAFDLLWQLYMEGSVLRLSIHPVANFVLAKAIERINKSSLKKYLDEMEGGEKWGKVIRAGRTGVLKAVIDRSVALGDHQGLVLEATYDAFSLTTEEDKALLVQCCLSLLPLAEYNNAVASSDSVGDKKKTQEVRYRQGRPIETAPSDPLEPKVQGALLLQSLIRLSEPYNLSVVKSVTSLSLDKFLSVAHHPVSSRVLDALLDSPTVPYKSKRTFVLSLIGHFHTLVDDRIGSRVGDRCWAWADTYLKEKIARSLFPHENFLAASFYGKFFARNLNLYLLKRRPDEWKAMQSERSASTKTSTNVTKSNQPPVVAPVSQQLDTSDDKNIKSEDAGPSLAEKKKKRKREAANEIDRVFDESLGKKAKKGALNGESNSDKPIIMAEPMDEIAAPSNDRALNEVIGAIRDAPRGKEVHGTGKKRRRGNG